MADAADRARDHAGPDGNHTWAACATCAEGEGCWICLDCGAEGKTNDADNICEVPE